MALSAGKQFNDEIIMNVTAKTNNTSPSTTHKVPTTSSTVPTTTTTTTLATSTSSATNTSTTLIELIPGTTTANETDDDTTTYIIIGVFFAVVVLAAVCAILIVLLCRRRRRRKNKTLIDENRMRETSETTKTHRVAMSYDRPYSVDKVINGSTDDNLSAVQNGRRYENARFGLQIGKTNVHYEHSAEFVSIGNDTHNKLGDIVESKNSPNMSARDDILQGDKDCLIAKKHIEDIAKQGSNSSKFAMRPPCNRMPFQLSLDNPAIDNEIETLPQRERVHSDSGTNLKRNFVPGLSDSLQNNNSNASVKSAMRPPFHKLSKNEINIDRTMSDRRVKDVPAVLTKDRGHSENEMDQLTLTRLAPTSGAISTTNNVIKGSQKLALRPPNKITHTQMSLEKQSSLPEFELVSAGAEDQSETVNIDKVVIGGDTDDVILHDYENVNKNSDDLKSAIEYCKSVKPVNHMDHKSNERNINSQDNYLNNRTKNMDAGHGSINKNTAGTDDDNTCTSALQDDSEKQRNQIKQSPVSLRNTLGSLKTKPVFFPPKPKKSKTPNTPERMKKPLFPTNDDSFRLPALNSVSEKQSLDDNINDVISDTRELSYSNNHLTKCSPDRLISEEYENMTLHKEAPTDNVRESSPDYIIPYSYENMTLLSNQESCYENVLVTPESKPTPLNMADRTFETSQDEIHSPIHKYIDILQDPAFIHVPNQDASAVCSLPGYIDMEQGNSIRQNTPASFDKEEPDYSYAAPAGPAGLTIGRSPALNFFSQQDYVNVTFDNAADILKRPRPPS